ncbi:hypothetical protein M878_11395 [Streptomyces roseochromogenus subsp. oscitans DS 12.976]|uniref:HTH tetR-type domain-containing protein n=1 Tax=Streptomyces roseochromogenus subsp. oscitans DS 12.976 TaxID=1352936 RepID=V6KQ19_STRRC|nr:hypothetical protein M878_11395 [Streptomyces roseochromogenus subsp. oscitans DS 12.976]
MRTRQELIRAAAEAFALRSYHQATIADISEAAGVSPGGLHFHFTNKAAIAEAVEDEAAQLLRATCRDARSGAHTSLQALIDASHAIAALLSGNIVARAGLLLGQEPTRSSKLSLHQEWAECIHLLVRRAVEEGQLSSDVSPRDLYTAVLAATVGLEALGRGDGRWLTPQTLASFWRLLLPRICPPHRAVHLNPTGTAAR